MTLLAITCDVIAPTAISSYLSPNPISRAVHEVKPSVNWAPAVRSGCGRTGGERHLTAYRAGIAAGGGPAPARLPGPRGGSAGEGGGGGGGPGYVW